MRKIVTAVIANLVMVSGAWAQAQHPAPPAGGQSHASPSAPAGQQAMMGPGMMGGMMCPMMGEMMGHGMSHD